MNPYPGQKFFVGDLVLVNGTKGFRFTTVDDGDMGIITKAWVMEVCTKTGVLGLPPEAGGPTYGWEWGYVAFFANGPLRGVRLDNSSSVVRIDASITRKSA